MRADRKVQRAGLKRQFAALKARNRIATQLLVQAHGIVATQEKELEELKSTRILVSPTSEELAKIGPLR